MFVSMTLGAKDFAIIHVISVVWKLRKRLDVMDMKNNFCSATLTYFPAFNAAAFALVVGSEN